MRLRIAVQKSGRLSESSLALLKDCGIRIQQGRGVLIAPSTNFELDVLYLRDDDIPDYVADGTADCGMLGENVVLEEGVDVRTEHKLGFAGCRLSLAVPKAVDYPGVAYFNGRKIATSYPVILRRFLDERGVDAEIHEISGSVEIAPNIGLADGICDIVSTGSTLFSNGLKEVEHVIRSEAVLISRPGLPAAKRAILDKLLFRIRAVQRAADAKYIVMNVPADKVSAVQAILPGIRSPTVVPLAEEGWCAVHSVVEEATFWEMIDEVRAAGAEGIVVMPVQKMVV